MTFPDATNSRARTNNETTTKYEKFIFDSLFVYISQKRSLDHWVVIISHFIISSDYFFRRSFNRIFDMHFKCVPLKGKQEPRANAEKGEKKIYFRGRYLRCCIRQILTFVLFFWTWRLDNVSFISFFAGKGLLLSCVFIIRFLLKLRG